MRAFESLPRGGKAPNGRREVTMKLSLTSVAMPRLSLEETVEFATRLGYDGVELRVRRIPTEAAGQPYSFWGNHANDLNPDNFVRLAPRIAGLCADAGLAIPALASNATATQLEDLNHLAEGAAICGCPLVRIGAPRRYDGSASYHDLYSEAVDAFGRALEVVQSHGRRGLLEIHGGTIAVSAGLAYRLVSNFSPEAIGVIYDVQNMVREGYEGTRLGLDLLGPYLAHVHIGGHAPWPGDRDARGTLAWNWRQSELADGLLNVPDLFADLRRVGYDRFVTVEDLRPDVEAESKFRSALQYLRGLAV
jgi:sugar phosphate isomerase/epimerase